MLKKIKKVLSQSETQILLKNREYLLLITECSVINYIRSGKGNTN